MYKFLFGFIVIKPFNSCAFLRAAVQYIDNYCFNFVLKMKGSIMSFLRKSFLLNLVVLFGLSFSAFAMDFDENNNQNQLGMAPNNSSEGGTHFHAHENKKEYTGKSNFFFDGGSQPKFVEGAEQTFLLVQNDENKPFSERLSNAAKKGYFGSVEQLVNAGVNHAVITVAKETYDILIPDPEKITGEQAEIAKMVQILQDTDLTYVKLAEGGVKKFFDEFDDQEELKQQLLAQLKAMETTYLAQPTEIYLNKTFALQKTRSSNALLLKIKQLENIGQKHEEADFFSDEAMELKKIGIKKLKELTNSLEDHLTSTEVESVSNWDLRKGFTVGVTGTLTIVAILLKVGVLGGGK